VTFRPTTRARPTPSSERYSAKHLGSAPRCDLPTDLTNGPVRPRAYWGGRDAARQERVSGHAARDRTECFLSLQTLLQLLNELAVTRSPTFEVL
jgi:hypothetical protein